MIFEFRRFVLGSVVASVHRHGLLTAKRGKSSAQPQETATI